MLKDGVIWDGDAEELFKDRMGFAEWAELAVGASVCVGPRQYSEAEEAGATPSRIWDFFVGYDRGAGFFEANGKRSPNGKLEGSAWTEPRGATEADWAEHLRGGRKGLGLVPLLADNTVRFAAIDVDDYKIDHKALAQKVADLNLPLTPFRSKSAGAHLFCFVREPVPAADMMGFLDRCRELLGLPKKTELFPKQITREPGDTGNWINLPYFGGDRSTRFAFTADQPHMTLEQCEAHLAKVAMSREEFYAAVAAAKAAKPLARKASAQPIVQGAELVAIDDEPDATEEGTSVFSDGPPCLQTIAAHGGFREGERNQGMFNVAVYVKKKHPRDWERHLEQLNQQLCLPPLEDRELVKSLERSHGRRDYGYKCSQAPIAPHCNKSVCLTRSYGVGGPGVRLGHFVAYMPTHSYMFLPTMEMWSGASVNAKIGDVPVPGQEKPVAATAWLDRNRAVEQMTWAPGRPRIIKDLLIADSGFIEHVGARVLNVYRPPAIVPQEGDPSPWLNHLRKLYGEDAEHLIKWFAQRVQHPEIKINHALVLGGAPQIGKDTLLEPVIRAVGQWNCAEISPKQIGGRFNGYLKAVILRISEVRDLGDVDRFAFYEATKTMSAAPPATSRIDEKFKPEYMIPNIVGLIHTTNHKTDGMYLAGDDRRHFVAWSECQQSEQRRDFEDGYFSSLWSWYEQGGFEIVAHYLRTLDLTGFDPKAPPRKTEAFWAIVNAHHAPENAELADVIDRLSEAPAVTLNMLVNTLSIYDPQENSFREWLMDRRNRKRIPHRMDEVGFVPQRNPYSPSDGLWKVDGKRQVIYVRKELSAAAQLSAASNLSRRSSEDPSLDEEIPF